MIHPVAGNVLGLYPQANAGTTIYRTTVVTTNDFDQAGGRLDFNHSEADQFFGRYSYYGGHDINPVSVRGSEVPGFPTRNDIAGHNATISNNHVFSPNALNSARLAFFPVSVRFRPTVESDSATGFRIQL